MRRALRWRLPLIVVFVCDVAAYLMLMGRLGMANAGGAVVFACLVRAFYLPAGRILVSMMCRSKRVRVMVSTALSVVVYLGIIVHLIYAGYFRTVPHFKALHHLDDLPETLSQLVFQFIDVPVIVVLGLFVAQLIALLRFIADVRPAPVRAVVSFMVLLMVFVVHGRMVRMVYDRFGAVRSERLAVYGLPDAVLRFGLADLWWSQVEVGVRQLRWPIPLTEYPGKIVGEVVEAEIRQPLGLNLIMIQMESVDQWAIEADVRGRPVMPFLRSLQSRAQVFPNTFAQHSGGGSSDAELAGLLSVLPLATHSGLLTADFKRLNPLPRHLAEHGYRTVAMHANRATYFNRNLAYPRLGFDLFLSSDSFRGTASGWGSRDGAFLAQSMETLQNLPKPFFAFLITMQSHGPFTNHGRRPAADPGPGFDQLERDYLQCMAEVDAALELFWTSLETSGLADRSVMMLYGDHSSQVADHRVEGKETVPLMVLVPGREPAVFERVGSHLDLAPTAAHLLGLAEPEGWIGSSMLAPGPGTALFNDLTEIRFEDGQLVSRRAEDYMPFLLYSATVLDP